MRLKLENCVTEREGPLYACGDHACAGTYDPLTDLGPIRIPRPFLTTSNTAYRSICMETL